MLATLRNGQAEPENLLDVRRFVLALLFAAVLILPAPSGRADATLVLGKTVVMRAAAVAQTADGFVGSTATISITAGSNGAGHVFLDTFPLTEVDMQGSARLAARVASQVTGNDLATHDFFFVIRSNSVQIGGPSAGADMTVGAIAALQGWDVRADALETGTIQPDGSVGPVGGIPEKAAAAQKAGMHLFLYPEGQDIQPLSGQKGVRVNMPEYCRSLGANFECKPIGDVIDAVNLMTDHVIAKAPVTGNVTDARYLATLKPASEELLQSARVLVEEASAAVGALPPGATRTGVQGELRASNDTYQQALAAVSNGSYYAAASLSFQTSTNARYVRDFARVLAQPPSQQAAAARSDLDAAQAAVARVRSNVDAARVSDTSQLEPVGAAQTRIMEAEMWLESARLALANATTQRGALSTTEHDATYAVERAGTARWWLELGAKSERGAAVDPQGLANLAQDSLTAANEVVAYVDAVFKQATVNGAVAPAQAALDNADKALGRGYAAAALFAAFEAQTKASVALEDASFSGGIPVSKLELARVSAARAIQQARERGSEPFLAESQYEFGLSETVPLAYRLEYLREARLTANVAGLPGLFSQTQRTESRFQGLPDTLGVAPGWVAAAFALGIAAGAGLGLAALMPRADAKKKDAPEEEAKGPPALEW